LKDAGLNVDRKDVPSSEQPETVVEQDPVEGTLVRPDTTVTLSVSRAPVELPNVVQQDVKAAQATLEDLGFAVEISPQVVSDPSQVDVVLEQFPSGEVQAGATVTLTVGTLPAITVPTTTSP
jgi:serine/threonine-protein kinase